MKQIYIIAKTIGQIFLYLLEVVGMSIIIANLTTSLAPVYSLFEFIERTIMCYTIYQILIIVILTNLNDIQKDSCLAYITNLKKCLLYIETKESYIKEDILKNINYQLDDGTFNNNEFRKAYENIKNNIDNFRENYIKMELINAEHIYEMNSLNWRFSFLLRLVK